MAKKIDLKPLIIAHGERIGLCVASALTLILVVVGVLKALGSSSATTNAADLNKRTQDLAARQRSARPDPNNTNHVPGPPPKVDAQAKLQMVAAADYPSHKLFEGARVKDTLRSKPNILVPDEVQVEYVRAHLPALAFQFPEVGNKGVPTEVAMVEVKGGAAGAAGVIGAAGAMGGVPPGYVGPQTGKGLGDLFNQNNRGGGAFGAFPQPGQMGGLPGQVGAVPGQVGAVPGARGQVRLPGQLNPRRLQKAAPGQGNQVKWFSIAQAENPPPNHQLAWTSLPLRMAVVVASFPYKQQVEEFRQKLHLDTHGAVLTERVKGEKEEDSWNSFQFRGLIVERATIEVGKPLEWEPIPFEESFKRIALLTFRQKEKDSPDLDPILEVSKKLVLPLPKQFHKEVGVAYTDLVSKLNNVQNTVAKLKADEAKSKIVKPSKIIDDGFDPYDLGGNTTQKAPGGGGSGNPPVVPPDTGKTGDKANPWVIAGTGQQRDIKETPIDHCLIRFVDVTLEPGKAYRYRMKVRMANPNYSPKPGERKDTYPQFAEDKELVSDWFEVPQTVVAPPDSLIYAVDQAGIDRERGVRAPDPNEAVVQIHRWVEEYRNDPSKPETKPVGEWVIAKRILVRKGEYVRDRRHKTPIPIKPLELPGDQLDLDEKTSLDFGDETVLVDFEGGKMNYERVEGMGETAKRSFVFDQASTELLLMTPDGRLQTRVDSIDAFKEERVVRYQSYQKQVKSIRDRKSGGGGNPVGGNPLGG